MLEALFSILGKLSIVSAWKATVAKFSVAVAALSEFTN